MSTEARLAVIAFRTAIIVKQARINRKLKKQIEELETRKTELANLYAKELAENLYLYHLLDQHRIAPTQFDLIAISNIRSA